GNGAARCLSPGRRGAIVRTMATLRFAGPLTALLAGAAAAQIDGKVHYKSSDFAADALPATAPKALREALAGYAPLLQKLKLRGYVAQNESCCLMHSHALHSASSLWSTIDKTNAFFGSLWGSQSEAEPYVVVVLDKQEELGGLVDFLVPKY